METQRWTLTNIFERIYCFHVKVYFCSCALILSKCWKFVSTDPFRQIILSKLTIFNDMKWIEQPNQQILYLLQCGRVVIWKCAMSLCLAEKAIVSPFDIIGHKRKTILITATYDLRLWIYYYVNVQWLANSESKTLRLQCHYLSYWSHRLHCAQVILCVSLGSFIILVCRRDQLLSLAAPQYFFFKQFAQRHLFLLVEPHPPFCWKIIKALH